MFKKCFNCNFEWNSIDEFIHDKSNKYIGYQADFKDPIKGAFLFNHKCRTTMAVPVPLLADYFLIQNNTDAKYNPGTAKDCPKFCLTENNIENCPVTDCKGYWVRLIIKKIKEIKLSSN